MVKISHTIATWIMIAGFLRIVGNCSYKNCPVAGRILQEVIIDNRGRQIAKAFNFGIPFDNSKVVIDLTADEYKSVQRVCRMIGRFPQEGI